MQRGEKETEESVCETSIDTLKNNCIKSFNTTEFRNYFKENLIHTEKCEEFKSNVEEKLTIESGPSEKSGSSEDILEIVELKETHHTQCDNVMSSKVKDMQEPDNEEEPHTENHVITSVSVQNVPSLRHLALQAVRLNESNMATNLKPLKIVFEFESQRKVGKVPSLQELAREVANTIYSFNVKPLKEICKLALEKFNHLYLVSRIEASSTNIIPVTSGNIPEPNKVPSPQIEEQSDLQKLHPNGILSPYNMIETVEDDETPVKSLKILAQICVDELEKCNENEMLAIAPRTENSDSIYISSESDSESDNSIRRSQRGVIIGGTRKSSGSDSESSSESESSSDSSSSNSDDSDSDDNEQTEEKTKELVKLPEKEKEKEEEHNKNDAQNDVVQQIVEDWSVECDEEAPLHMEESVNTNEDSNLKSVDEKPKDEVYNPSLLRDICKDVLQAHSMIIRYDVPTLKYLCEHTLASNGMEIPLICFVPDDSYEYISTDQPSNDENVYLCLDSEFDETELANLFNGAGSGVYESIEFDTRETGGNATDKASLIDQCVALESILSSPLPEDHELSDEPAFYMDANGFHDSIQYEETVLQSENSAENSMVAILSFKKYLQKKYVQPSIYHKMFAINKLLRKYKVHQVSCSNRKPIVQKRLKKILSKFCQRNRERRKPKKLATRRSARIADKIKQKYDESDWQIFEKPIKSTKANKVTKGDTNKLEPGENRRLCKLLNVNDIIQNSVSKNVKHIDAADKESITRDILKLIAKKRTLKRKLSICHRPTNLSFDEDGYCYDEDGQISEMLSSFINTGFNEKKSESFGVKKSRSRRTSIEGNTTKNPDIKKKKLSPLSVKKQPTTEDKLKKKKIRSKEKNAKKVIAANKIANSQENTVPLTEASAINKTENKNTMVKKTHNFASKIHIKEVKEIVPAKRTRFLSIDGSLMKYGAERKKDNQLRTESEIIKRKIPPQKLKRIKDINLSVNENLKSKNPIEPNPLERTAQSQLKITLKTQGKKNVELKESKPIKPTKALRELITSTKNDLSLSEIPERRTTAATTQEDSIKDTGKSNATHLMRISLKNKAAIADHLPPLNITCLEKDQQDDKSSSPDSNIAKLNTKKSSKKAQDKPLSERNLCSTLVSPLRIIIEPKRITHEASIDKTIQKDPLAVDVKYQLSPKIAESLVVVKPTTVRKERVTRFSERITNHVETEKVLSVDSDTFATKLPSLKNSSVSIVASEENNKMPKTVSIYSNGELPVKETANNVPAFLTEKPIFPKTNMSESDTIKPYLDIETLLPVTKILQPRPAKRCLSRAQTISHTESPFRNISVEPMKLRSSNNFWNRRNTPNLNDYNSNQYNNNLPHKYANTPYIIPKKRKQTPTPVQTPRATTPLQKTPIDLSSFPDPESLQIPSIDLRSTSSIRSIQSPLSLPVSMPIPMPVSVPMPMILRTKPVTVNSEVMKGFDSKPSKIEPEKTSETNCKSDNLPSITELRHFNQDPRSLMNKNPRPLINQDPRPLITADLRPLMAQDPRNTSQGPRSPMVQKAQLQSIQDCRQAATDPRHIITLDIEQKSPITSVNLSTNTQMNQRINEISSATPNVSPNTLNAPVNERTNVKVMPEMNTIPLELDRVVTQQRKIREMRRRNSLCVAEISNYQRNILSKFANSIKQKKIKVEDILKTICNKQASPSSSSASSSSSDSESSESDSSDSDSSSSSTSSGSVRKSRRNHKKKRSRRRNSNTDDSSSESSSSSSTSSSSSSKHGSKRSKRYRKSARKSSKHTNNRRKSNPKPIFDIETIKQNALMGCVMHEEIMRSKLNQMTYSSIMNNDSACTSYIQKNQSTPVVVSSSTPDATADSDSLKIPYVKLQRNTIIDGLAQNYSQEQHSTKITDLTRYKRKRSD